MASLHTVLIVDDEPAILSSLKRLLHKENYRLLTAGNGEQGLARLRETPVHLVISDQRMPAMDGVNFLQKSKTLCPDAVRVILSGYSDAHVIIEAINEGEIYRFISKPWHDEELKVIIRQCLEHHDLVLQNRSLSEEANLTNNRLKDQNDDLTQQLADRTLDLRYARELLEFLPVAVVGIGMDLEIVLANAHARRMYPDLELAPPGEDVTDVIAGDLAGILRQRLATDKGGGPLEFSWDGRRIEARMQQLGELDRPRGCLLVLPDPEEVHCA